MPSNQSFSNPTLPGEVPADERSTMKEHFEESQEQSHSSIDPLEKHIQFSSNIQKPNLTNCNPVVESQIRSSTTEPEIIDPSYRAPVIFAGPYRHSFSEHNSLVKPEPTGKGSAPVSTQELQAIAQNLAAKNKPYKKFSCICQ